MGAFDIGALGMQAAGGVIGAGMGLLLEGHNDKRQIEQQTKLQALQIAGQKEMSDYNYGKQLQMWHDTNYSAQKAEIEKAGLNPALLYGMSGGGGITTGSPSGNVTGGTAPQGGHETIDSVGMGMQLQMMNAQTKVLESQANLNNVEAKKKEGIDTKIGESQNEAILQGVDNLRQDYELKRLEITANNIRNYEQQASQSDRLDYIEYQTKSALKQLNILGNDNKISDATVTDNIKRIKAEAIGAVLHNILTQSQISKTNSDISVNNENIRKIANDILLNWDKLSNDNKQIEIQKQLKDWTTDPNRHAVDQAVQSLNSIIHLAR